MTVWGLSQAEALERLRLFGPNELPEPEGISLMSRLVKQLASPIIWLLLFAVVFDAGLWAWEGGHGFPFEAVAILGILVLNTGLGVYQEYRADAAIGKLKDLSAPLAWVYRDGELVHLPASQLVPGDVVRVEAGDRIPADGSLVDASNAMLDESVLTGESIPVEKESGTAVFSGTQLVRGRALIHVSQTGSASTLGKLASSLESIGLEKTPLEKKLDRFGRQVARWILALAALLLVVGTLLEGLDALSHVLLFAVALAVAAIPEGMPAVLTLTLARGVERMAARQAVVRRMSAVEALGSVTVIATDKTGTLTENRMFVRELISDAPEEAVAAMMLANDADPAGHAGDPLELALFAYAEEQGNNPAAFREANPRVSILPFDSANKFMRVTCIQGGKLKHYLKGAPEVLLDRSVLDAASRSRWQRVIDEAASSGHRLLAMASSNDDPDRNLTFLGIVLLWDPPRPEVPGAISRALAAGVRVVMVTGDHPATARAVAQSVGISTNGVLTGSDVHKITTVPADVNVFARVLPEDKLRLVELLKSQGEIVAMTGDGVNDAPALKRADVGVAMGQRGSDVTREVADLVLLDDNFATIVAAIEQGRSIYANIQKFIRFLFSTNLAEIIILLGGSVGSVALGFRDAAGAVLLPLTAVQLLWINLVTDGPVALALGLDEDPDVMTERPRRPQTPLLDQLTARFIVVTGVFKAGVALTLLAFLPMLALSPEVVRTAVFHYVVLAQLAFAYAARGVMHSKVHNWALAGAVVLGLVVQAAIAALPTLRAMLGITVVSVESAAVVLIAVLLTWIGAEVYARTRWAVSHA